MYTLTLRPNDFAELLKILEEYKSNSETLKNFKNWAEIYQSQN